MISFESSKVLRKKMTRKTWSVEKPDPQEFIISGDDIYIYIILYIKYYILYIIYYILYIIYYILYLISYILYIRY